MVRGGDATQDVGSGGSKDDRCNPDCIGKKCGSDGCGGQCGTCVDPCGGDTDPAELCAEGFCTFPCSELRVTPLYDGTPFFNEVTAYVFEGNACGGVGDLDPESAPYASPSAPNLSTVLSLPGVPAGPKYVAYVKATGPGGILAFGCNAGVELAGEITSINVALESIPVSFDGVYELDNLLELGLSLPPSIETTLAVLNEMSDDHDLQNAYPNNGQYGEDPAAFLLDFVYRQFCCWEAIGPEASWDSCRDQEFTHAFGDLTALYLEDFTKWLGAWPVFTGLCGGLEYGVNEYLQSEVMNLLDKYAPGMADFVMGVPEDLSEALRHMTIVSQLTTTGVHLSSTGGYTHELVSMKVVLHDMDGESHAFDFLLADAGLTSLSQSGTTTADGKILLIPAHSFQLEFGKLLQHIYLKGLLQIFGYTSTEEMLNGWIDCHEVAVYLEDKISDFDLIDEEDYEEYCHKGLEEAGEYIEDAIEEAVEAVTILHLQGTAVAGEVDNAHVAVTLVDGVWQGSWEEDGQSGEFPGFFTGVGKSQ